MKITVTGKILNAEPGDLVRYGTKNCLVVRMTDEACIEIMSSPEPRLIYGKEVCPYKLISVNTGLDSASFSCLDELREMCVLLAKNKDIDLSYRAGGRTE